MIPIFLFHRVGPRSDCRFTVGTDLFEEYLEIIRQEGFETLSCRELVAIAVGLRPTPARSCVLTFDDGLADVWVYATPLLAKHNARATIFVTTERIGARQKKSWVSSGSGSLPSE